MLNIFTLAYQGAAVAEVPTGGTREQIQHIIFARYIERMLHRRRSPKTGNVEQMQRWMTFLGQQMYVRKQTVFLVEELQGSWLLGIHQHRYRWSWILTDGLIFGLPFGLAFGLIAGSFAGLIGALIGMLHVTIEPQAIIWSWRRALTWLPFGLIVVPVIWLMSRSSIAPELIWPLPNGVSIGMIALIAVLVAGLFGGMFGKPELRPADQTNFSPNTYIWRSAKSGLSGLLLAGFIGGLTSPARGLVGTLATGLVLGICVGMGTGLPPFLEHFILRFWLWCAGYLPWKLIPFLDEAAERLLLYKVGGSYIFVHRLLMVSYYEQCFSIHLLKKVGSTFYKMTVFSKDRWYHNTMFQDNLQSFVILSHYALEMRYQDSLSPQVLQHWPMIHTLIDVCVPQGTV
jgi:hypothetical protein